MTTAPVTIEQAAAILGVSASTIRRRIKAGTLRVEEARRPHGVVWLVHLPPGTAPAAATATVDTAPVDTTATTPTAPADAIAAMIQAPLTPIIAPLVGQVDAQRQTIERQAEQLVIQAEALGRVTAERDAARAEVETAEGRSTVPRPRSGPGDAPTRRADRSTATPTGSFFITIARPEDGP